MIFQRRRSKLFSIFIVMFVSFVNVLLFHRFYYSIEVNVDGKEFVGTTDEIPSGDIKLYFESDIAFAERLKLQSNILFGSKIKGTNIKHFSEREGVNETFVDSLPLFRNITDYRPEGCDNFKYRKSNTTISVVLNYHNEILSLLLRTIYTTLRAIPPGNLHELILIDDASNLTTHPDLKLIQPLVSTFTVPVRFFRFEVNKGLVFCRPFGARQATGDVVMILDTHVEIPVGSVEPLLNVTDANYKAIAAPIFDFMETFNGNTWHYDGMGFAYDTYLGWRFSPGPKTAPPWKTPGILGGAFVATKRRLEEIQYFGVGMVGWGGENVELCLKNWMCGGEVWYVSCSRCLHFAAKRNPSAHGERTQPKYQAQNVATVAKSFLGDTGWQEYLRGNPGAINAFNHEAVEQNKALLHTLQCSRNYTWVLENLMTNVESYNERSLIAQNLMHGEKCVHLEQARKATVGRWILRQCPHDPPAKTTIRFTMEKELRTGDRLCVDHCSNPPVGTGCHMQGGNQITKYSLADKRLKSNTGALCLTSNGESDDLSWTTCLHDPDPSQEFQWKAVYHPNLLK